MKKKLTRQQIERIQVWYASWSVPRKKIAAELGVCCNTLMKAAKRIDGYRNG